MADAEYPEGERISRDMKDVRPEAESGRNQAEEAVYEKLVGRASWALQSEEVRDHDEGTKELAAVSDSDADRFQMIGRGTGVHSGSKARAGAVGSKVLQGNNSCSTFRMPMHYPRYSKADYEIMPEWRLDLVFQEYGLPVNVASTLDEKREYAMGVFLWGSQHTDA